MRGRYKKAMLYELWFFNELKKNIINIMTMKKLIFLFLLLAFVSCKKDKPGSVTYNMKFTTGQIGGGKSNHKSNKQNADTLYTQFGDYITSLTPPVFTSRVWTIGYIDRVLNPSDNSANMLQFIDQNGSALPFEDPSRLVDFSGNVTRSFQPLLFGDMNGDYNIFTAEEINFTYFYFMPFYFYQEFTLPSQYGGIVPDMFPLSMDPHPAVLDGSTLKVQHYQMMKKIFPNANTNFVVYYIFGNCDSTYVVNPNSELVGLNSDCPINNDMKSDLIIRSNQYTNMIFTSPYDGNDVVMNGTISIDTHNLIQIYAGVDNIPYTQDDIFVYAPRYWERFNASLEVE
jgi:hypothetical protein